MKNKKSFVSFVLIAVFMFGTAALSSCGGSKKSTKVRSGSSMGNMKHKNKHVWGK